MTSVTLGGLRLVRATVRQSSEQDHFEWHLEVYPQGSKAEKPLVVLADLHKIHDGWLVGATIGSVIEAGELEHEVADEDWLGAIERDVTAIYGHVLWDAAAAVVRQQAALAGITDFGIPLSRPAGNHFVDGKGVAHVL